MNHDKIFSYSVKVRVKTDARQFNMADEEAEKDNTEEQEDTTMQVRYPFQFIIPLLIIKKIYTFKYNRQQNEKQNCMVIMNQEEDATVVEAPQETYEFQDEPTDPQTSSVRRSQHIPTPVPQDVCSMQVVPEPSLAESAGIETPMRPGKLLCIQDSVT